MEGTPPRAAFATMTHFLPYLFGEFLLHESNAPYGQSAQQRQDEGLQRAILPGYLFDFNFRTGACPGKIGIVRTSLPKRFGVHRLFFHGHGHPPVRFAGGVGINWAAASLVKFSSRGPTCRETAGERRETSSWSVSFLAKASS